MPVHHKKSNWVWHALDLQNFSWRHDEVAAEKPTGMDVNDEGMDVKEMISHCAPSLLLQICNTSWCPKTQMQTLMMY